MTGDRGLAVLCQCEARDRLAAELFDAESEHRAECPIAMTEAPIGVREGYADRRMLDGVAKQRFHLPEVRGCLQRLRESRKYSGLGACELHDTVPMGERPWRISMQANAGAWALDESAGECTTGGSRGQRTRSHSAGPHRAPT